MILGRGEFDPAVDEDGDHAVFEIFEAEALQFDLVAGIVCSLLGQTNGCRWLEGDAEIDRFTVGNSTLDATTAIG